MPEDVLKCLRSGVVPSYPAAPAARNSTFHRRYVSRSPTSSENSGPDDGYSARWADRAATTSLPRGTVRDARAAQRKGRSYQAWFWIAFFFLIPAAIIVAIMGPKPEYVVASTATPSSMEPVKRCPYCGEEILAVAKKCKHCGEFLQDD